MPIRFPFPWARKKSGISQIGV
jgi:hypothetical protein